LTDDQGRFSFTVLGGTVGWLRAKIPVYELKYSDCPQAEKLLAASDKPTIDLQTRAIKPEANRDIRDIKLTGPFAYCPGAE
jgi:hypothetical protein